jgi:hypothetical protein
VADAPAVLQGGEKVILQRQGRLAVLVGGMTDGGPSDTALFETICGELAKNKYSFAMTIGCAAGPKTKVEPYTGGGHVRGRESGHVLRPPMAPVWNLLKFNFFNFSQILSYISV